MARKKKSNIVNEDTALIKCSCGKVVGTQILAKYDNTSDVIDSGGDSYRRVFNDDAFRDNFGNVMRINHSDNYWCKECKNN